MKIRQEVHPFGERDDVGPEISEFDSSQGSFLFRFAFEELGCFKMTEEYEDGTVIIFRKVEE